MRYSKNSTFKKRFISMGMLLLMFFISGCLEQETTGDTTQREYDRENEAAAAFQLSQNIYGNYVGENADYGRITALFMSFEEPQDGSLGPLPSIAGNFIFTKRSTDPKMKGAPDEEFSSTIKFENGRFNPKTNKIDIKIQLDPPVSVNCEARLENELHCVWFGSHTKTGFEEFDLKKVN